MNRIGQDWTPCCLQFGNELSFRLPPPSSHPGLLLALMPVHSGQGHPPIDPPVLSRRRSNSVQNPLVRPRVQRTHSNPSEDKLVLPQPIQFTSSSPPPPPRPYRNPARTSVSTQHVIPPSPHAGTRAELVFPRVPRTGPQEEITPWELEPFPAENVVGTSVRELCYRTNFGA